MEQYQKELTHIQNILKDNPKGMSVTEIAKTINVNRNSVAKYLDVLLITGRVEMKTVGPAKIYFLSNRVPISAMLDFSSDSILVFDSDLKIIQVNENFLEFMSIDQDFLIGHQLADLDFHIFVNPEIRDAIVQAREGVDSSRELQLQVSDDDVYVRLKFLPTTFDDGSSGVTLIIENITEQRKAEHYYQLLAENVTDVIWTTDLDLYYTYISPSILKARGYRVEEMIGKQIKDFLDPVSYERVKQALEDELAKERMGSVDLSRSWTIDVEVLQKDGSTAWTEITTTFLRAPDGCPTGHLGITRDITARKLSEEALKQKSHDLAQRVKELACLYEISQLVDVYDSLDKILQGIVEIIPTAWQYPNVTCVRMIVGEQEIQTKNFKSSHWKQQSNIFVHGERFGSIEVNYLEDMPIQDEGPFLKEERNLLNMISERVGRIIERKKAEETLIQVEEEQHIVLDSLSELVSHLDTQMRFVWANRAATEEFGIPLNDLIGTYCYARHGRSEPCDNCTVVKVLNTGQIQVAEVEYTDGRFMFSRSYPIRDVAGEFTGVVEIASDITEKKRIEEQLHYRATLFEKVSDAIISTDLNFVIQSWNKAAESIYGWQAEAVVGKRFSEIIPTEYLHDQAEEVLREFEEQGGWQGEVLQKKKNGTPLRIFASVTLIRNDDGNPIGTIAINRDITMRKQVEDVTERMDNELQQIIDIADDGVRVIDTDFNVLRANEPLSKLVGIKMDEILGKKCYRTFPGPTCHTSKCPLTRILDGEEYIEETIDKTRVDGFIVPCIRVVKPFRMTGGELIGIVEGFRTIPEQNQGR